MAAVTRNGDRRKKNNIWYQGSGRQKKEFIRRFFSSDCHFYYGSAKARTPEHVLRPLHVLQQPRNSTCSPNRQRVEDLTTDLLFLHAAPVFTFCIYQHRVRRLIKTINIVSQSAQIIILNREGK